MSNRTNFTDAQERIPTESHEFAAVPEAGGKGEGTPPVVALEGAAAGTPTAAAEAPSAKSQAPSAGDAFADEVLKDEPAPASRGPRIKIGQDYYWAFLSPDYQDVPEWRKEPEYKRLVASAVRDGKFQSKILGSLVLTDPNLKLYEFEIKEGRHRFWAASEAGLDFLEAEVTEMPAKQLITRSLLERAHMTKGARAYLVWPLITPAVEANKEARKERHLENLKKINSKRKQKGEATESGLNQLSVEPTPGDIAEAPVSEAMTKTLVAMAESYGLDKTLFDQARRVHEIFARRNDLKVENEDDILAGTLGMGAFLAGVAGREHTEGKTRKDADPITLLKRGFKDLTVRFSRWDTIPEEMRRVAADDAVDHVITAWPADVRKKLKLALQ